MANLFGALGLADTDRVFNATVGQRVIYDYIAQQFADWNAKLNAATSVFVESRTADYKLRYKLPGGGRLQRRGLQAQAAAVKSTGSWDVAFPLEDFGAQLAGSDVELAYMTALELSNHITTVQTQSLSTFRAELLKALLNNTQRTFVDPLWGSLSIEPLANNDSVVYPPVEGSESGATDDHYLESNYAASAISDTNNPIATLRDEVEEHYSGGNAGGSNLVTFINNAQTAKVTALSDFTKIDQRFVVYGDDTALANVNVPNLGVGKLLGYCSGSWIVEWRWMPANYMLTVHLDFAKPLYIREDPADTGLGSGLQLVSTDEDYPMRNWHYRHRFGFGCANRLNGAVMELGTGGSYTIPSAYA